MELCRRCWCGHQVGEFGSRLTVPEFGSRLTVPVLGSVRGAQSSLQGLPPFPALEEPPGLQLPRAPAVAHNRGFHHHPSSSHPSDCSSLLMGTARRENHVHRLCKKWSNLRAAKSTAMLAPCRQLAFTHEGFGLGAGSEEGTGKARAEDGIFSKKNSASWCSLFSPPLGMLIPKYPYPWPLFL